MKLIDDHVAIIATIVISAILIIPEMSGGKRTRGGSQLEECGG